MKIKWTKKALQNLEAEAEYIAKDKPAAARKMVARIKKAVTLLAEQPSAGRAGRVSGTRELIVPNTPYIIPYRIKEGRVEILRIFHASRQWPENL